MCANKDMKEDRKLLPVLELVHEESPKQVINEQPMKSREKNEKNGQKTSSAIIKPHVVD